MRGVRGTYVFLAAALLFSAHQAVGQTVNLFGQNWTGDVSPDSYNVLLSIHD